MNYDFSTYVENNLVNFGPLTKNSLDLRPMALKFNRVLEVVEVYIRPKSHRTECSGSWVIVLTNFFALCRNGKINRKYGPVTLRINTVRAVVKIHVHAKFHQAMFSRSWVYIELSWHREKTPTKTIQSVATARTVTSQPCSPRYCGLGLKPHGCNP